MSGHRKLESDQVVIASHNAGKVREIDALLQPFGVRAVSAAALGLAEPDETGNTFLANAQLKALAAATVSGLPALADDSGLCVDALDGAPGLYSARWAGPEKDFALAMQQVHDALRERQAPYPWRAHFVCALALAWPDSHVEAFEGKVQGQLVWPPRGTQGFGYDPMFQADGRTLTFGEMDPDAKHAMSHRARAFGQMVTTCLT